MKMNELMPGIYKIREKAVSIGNRRGRSFKNQIHLLRVTGTGQKRRYFVDHDTLGDSPRTTDFEQDYEMVNRYPTAPEVNKAQITISFSDGNGDFFEFTMYDAWRLRHIFEEMPWLQKGFGYEARKKGGGRG